MCGCTCGHNTINISVNNKLQPVRYSLMPRTATILSLALLSFHSYAQKSPRLLEKMGLGELQEKVNYIPTKSFTSLKHTGSDSVSFYRARTSTVEGFFISKTEVTNREYRQFVRYVIDSTAHVLMSHFIPGTNTLDWSRSIDWKDSRLEPMMIPAGESFSGRMEIDPGKIVYTIDRNGTPETISVYPDTLVWIRDFSFSYNEPLVKKYFSDPFYDHYPVVGICQRQATAYCQWMTNQVLLSVKDTTRAAISIGLPSNAQWESAAFEERDTQVLNVNSRHYRYNFGNIIDGNKKIIKTYLDDGFFYTGPVKSYPPGAYGLFDMKGNVSEWTRTAREEVMSTEIRSGMTSSSFVVKGGGWNSTPFYLQAGVCQFFASTAAHSYIGFRYVLSIREKTRQ